MIVFAGSPAPGPDVILNLAPLYALFTEENCDEESPIVTFDQETLDTLPVTDWLTLISNKNVLNSYVCEFDVFAAESNSNDLILAVPIFVFEIVPEDDRLIDSLGTQCISKLPKLFIGKLPTWLFVYKKLP